MPALVSFLSLPRPFTKGRRSEGFPELLVEEGHGRC